MLFNYFHMRCLQLKIEYQSLACNGLQVLKELVYCILFVITSLFIQSADVRPLNKTRIQGHLPKDTSQYNLKILLQEGSFLLIALHPRMRRNGFHKICRYRTLR